MRSLTDMFVSLSTAPSRPALVFCLLALPVAAAAQAQAHTHGPDAASAAHHHGGPVDCRTLATPPWSGLPAQDLARLQRLDAALAGLRTTDAARQAGYQPALGNIPTMGVHWVNARRVREGFTLEEPDHLMFALKNGREELVGVAYAFRGPKDAQVPHAFDSELAAWHDHEALGGPGQTLHMLHVWLVPSPYGPFAGNNFLLPFFGKGTTPPDACWFAGEEDVERFERVASTLALADALASREASPALARMGGAGFPAGQLRARMVQNLGRLDGWVTAMDVAAKNGDAEAWKAAATRMLEALTPAERQMMEAVRERVKGAQTPTVPPGPGAPS